MDLDAFEAEKNFGQTQRFQSYAGRLGGLARSTWTPERIEELKGLVEQKKTASEIAAVLGTTRNAIIGKAHREGLQICGLRPLFMDRAHIRERMRRRKKRAIDQHHFPIPVRPKQPIRRVIARTTYQPIVASNPVSLLSLESHHCKWVLGEPVGAATMYCGAVVAHDSSYCLGHRYVAYRGMRDAA